MRLIMLLPRLHVVFCVEIKYTSRFQADETGSFGNHGTVHRQFHLACGFIQVSAIVMSSVWVEAIISLSIVRLKLGVGLGGFSRSCDKVFVADAQCLCGLDTHSLLWHCWNLLC